MLTLLLAPLLLATACGSKPREVSKAHYQQVLNRLGTALTAAGSELGRSIDIATFNRNVDNFRAALDKAAHELDGLKPPQNVRGDNKRLAQSFRALAHELEPVKEARRQSIVKAREALGKVATSAAIRDGRAAIRDIKTKGYDVGPLSL
jgi:hypothetical protein